MHKRLPLFAALSCVCLSFAFRVVPGFAAVFTPRGISFQEADAWFHVRTVHNLLAHFPRRSGFDPFSLYPRGENVTTAPFWDYLLGSTAWLLGLSHPAALLTDEVGAWLPPILGASLSLMGFVFVRRLFGNSAALFSAFWIAVIPGTFLWVSHLGMADHHAAETFVSFLTLTLLCAATGKGNRSRWIAAAIAGLALTAYLQTRAAGIFVPATFAAASVFSVTLAPLSLVAVAIAQLVGVVTRSVSPWSEYTRLSLITCVSVTAPLALLNRFQRGRNWSRARLDSVAIIIAVLACGCVWLAEASEIRSLIHVVQQHTPGQATVNLAGVVKELQPIWKASPGGFGSLFSQFGVAWLLAVPGLLLVIGRAWRSREPALTLFAVWSFTMTAGVILQLRMAAYTGIVVGILAAYVCALILRRLTLRPAWLRVSIATAIVLIGLASSLPIGFAQTHTTQGPDSDWAAALDWLRWHTPDPMGDPQAWYRWYPRLDSTEQFVYPASAYGVLVPWDKGWWVSGIAHRIPSANGEVNGAIETSRFLTETEPADALRMLRSNGIKYAVIAPEQITTNLPSIVAAAGRSIDRYSRLFFIELPGGKRQAIRVYLPSFFRSMAARLYLFDGQPVRAAPGVRVFLTAALRNEEQRSDSPPRKEEETILSARTFPSEQEAEAWLARHPLETAILASSDPTSTCVDLEGLPWLTKVFASRDEHIVANRQPEAVKIFERVP